MSFAPGLFPAPNQPAAGDVGPGLIPVFFPDKTGDPEERDVDDKAKHLFDETIAGQITGGRPFPPSVPGGFEIEPAPELSPEAPPPKAPGVGATDPDVPQTGPVPVPLPIPLPGGNGPSTGTRPGDDEESACPTPEKDIGRGRNPSGDEFEYQMSLMINPESPTPKYSRATPNVTSEAYFLPSTAPAGRVSFDDCKKRGTPTTLPIPALKPGDMFEHKAGGWGWELGVPGSAAYLQFKNQVKNQNAAVMSEGRGRQIYYCVPSAVKAISAAKIFGGAYPNSHFLVCH